MFSKKAKQGKSFDSLVLPLLKKILSVPQPIVKSQANGKIGYFSLVLLLAKMVCSALVCNRSPQPNLEGELPISPALRSQ